MNGGRQARRVAPVPDFPRIIPALKEPEEMRDLPGRAVGPRVVFLLGGSLGTLGDATATLRRDGWRVYIHVDRVRGLQPDGDGLQFLKAWAAPEGVITTRASVVDAARHSGLRAVQRVFLLDSQSLATAIAQVAAARPDAVEVLPGRMPDVLEPLVPRFSRPVIAGGLVTTPAHCEALWTAGAVAVSTSARELWALDETPDDRDGRERRNHDRR
jgi:glycerol uptake operon antiterminator